LFLAGVAKGLAPDGVDHPPKALEEGLNGDGAAPDEDAAGWLEKAELCLTAANGDAVDENEPNVGWVFLSAGEEAIAAAESP
jgi:hypothetical protein